MKRLIVYHDGFCASCRASARAIDRLDWFRRIDLVSFREDTGYGRFGVGAEALEKSLHVVRLRRSGFAVFAGYSAVLAVMRCLPLLWPLLPLAWAVGACGLGERAYRWLAGHRVIVPDARHCQDGACEWRSQKPGSDG